MVQLSLSLFNQNTWDKHLLMFSWLIFALVLSHFYNCGWLRNQEKISLKMVHWIQFHNVCIQYLKVFLKESFKDIFLFPILFGLSSNSSLSMCFSRGQDCGCDGCENSATLSEYLEKLSDNFLDIFSQEITIFPQDLFFSEK